MARKKVESLHEVKITGRNFSKFGSASVWLDEELKVEFEKKGRDGQTRLSKLANGMAIRAFKHLYEQTVIAKKCQRLVLTKGRTRLDGQDLFLNVEEYSKAGQTTFLGLYRDAGLAVATSYLSTALPETFPKPTGNLTAEESRKAANNVSDVIQVSAKNRQGLGRVAKATKEALRRANEEKLELKQELNDIRQLIKSSKLAVYEQDLADFKVRLTKKYGETSGRGNWQQWFKDHSWVLGPNYGAPIDKAKVGFENIPDYLLPTLDGFADILELKLPSHSVVSKDPSHSGSYYWTGEASKAIGQASNYIQEAEDNRRLLKERIQDELKTELTIVRPRAFVIIGSDEDWDDRKKRAFRNLRSTLHGIEVYTYSDIVRRAESIIALLKDSED